MSSRDRRQQELEEVGTGMDEEVPVRQYDTRSQGQLRYNRLFWGGAAVIALLIIALLAWAYWARNNHEPATVTTAAMWTCFNARAGNASADVAALESGLAAFYRRQLNLDHTAWLATCDFARYFPTEFGDVSTRPLSDNHDYQRTDVLRALAQTLGAAYDTCGLAAHAALTNLSRVDLAFYLELSAIDYFLLQFTAAGLDGERLPDRVTAAAQALDTLLEDPRAGRCNGRVAGWRAADPAAFDARIVEWLTHLAPAVADWKRGLDRQVDLNKTHSEAVVLDHRDAWDLAAARNYSDACVLVHSNASAHTACLRAAQRVNEEMELFGTFFDAIYIWTAAAQRQSGHDDLALYADGDRALAILTEYHLLRHRYQQGALAAEYANR